MSNFRNNRNNQAAQEDSLGPIEVQVRDGNISKAIKSLQKLSGQEGLLWEIKRRQFYVKPSEARKEKSIRAERRRRRSAIDEQKNRDDFF